MEDNLISMAEIIGHKFGRSMVEITGHKFGRVVTDCSSIVVSILLILDVQHQ